MPHHLHTAPLPLPEASPTPEALVHLSSMSAGLAVLLVWTLVGLWSYMDSRGADWLMTLVGGPGAWLCALWDITHRKFFGRRKPILPKRQGESPRHSRWRNDSYLAPG